jgi:hypothetical protein
VSYFIGLATDLGYRGIWGIFDAFLMLIPLFNILPIIQLYFMKGSKETNLYGEPLNLGTTKSRRTIQIVETEREQIIAQPITGYVLFCDSTNS